ncbi:MAG: alpha/beta hydrolase fold domain-containing protein [Myxococcaceae bacterium]|nr:alpha/beta hydrolase fold domain-containing protein [Myxococcaceae bacterium]
MTDRPSSPSLRIQGTVELLRQQSRLLPKDPQRARALLDAASRSMPWPEVKESDATVAGVPCRLLLPDGASRGLLVYVHGGGFHGGSFATHAYLLRSLATTLKRRTVFPLYRLAPEHPFPAGLDDVTAVLDAAVAETDDVVLAGDSAGGTLALGALLATRPAQVHRVLLVSPWLDLTCRSPTIDAAPHDYLEAEVMRRLATSYLGGTAPEDPRASPLFANLAGLPPIFLASGGQEAFRGEIADFVSKARAAGVAVTHDEAADLPHAYPLVPVFGPERRRLLHRLEDWMRST